MPVSTRTIPLEILSEKAELGSSVLMMTGFYQSSISCSSRPHGRWCANFRICRAALSSRSLCPAFLFLFRSLWISFVLHRASHIYHCRWRSSDFFSLCCPFVLDHCAVWADTPELWNAPQRTSLSAAPRLSQFVLAG